MDELHVNLDAVIMTVVDDRPLVLTLLDDTGARRLPTGRLGVGDRTIELGLRRWVHDQTGLELGYVEQLYTFGDVDRDPDRPGRSLSIAYLALVHDARPSPEASWTDVYELLPWEDRRIDSHEEATPDFVSSLLDWEADTTDADERIQRSERVHVTFGLGDAQWDGVRVLERYELLFEVGLLGESVGLCDDAAASLEMALDHRRIVATALGRLRGKLTYRPVVFELLPNTFTLLQLQRVVESLSGVPLHKQNFRRLVERAGLVEGTGRMTRTAGRPAELFRFRREVLRERPRPGVGTPWASS